MPAELLTKRSTVHGRAAGQGEELTLSYHLQAEFVFQPPLRMQGKKTHLHMANSPSAGQ